MEKSAKNISVKEELKAKEEVTALNKTSNSQLFCGDCDPMPSQPDVEIECFDGECNQVPPVDVNIQLDCTTTGNASVQATSTVQAFIPAENIVNVRVIECGSKIDPELACISNDGGTTIVTGVVVYDISVNPPTETIYFNGTDVTGTYVKVPCEKNLDFETKETCYQDITDPNIKYTRIDWFEKDNLVVPVSTVWFDVTAGIYSATAPSNVEPCKDQVLTLKTGGVSIAGGLLTPTLGPNGTVWTNPGNLKSISIRARRSSTNDATLSVGNKVIVTTTDTKYVLLTGESATYSVEDGNILDFVSVEAMNNSAALVIYTRL